MDFSERPFNARSTSVDEEWEDSPLGSVTLERSEKNQFRWKWPDGSSRPASMTEVLLYEILYHVSHIGIDDDDDIPRPADTTHNS